MKPQEASSGPATSRLGWIVEARGLLALYVLLHHAALNIDTSGVRDGLWTWIHALFGYGHFRVDIFFVLSGYCLALSLRGASSVPDFKAFLLRRSARLLPPYFAALGLTLVLISAWVGQRDGTHWDASVPVVPGSVLAHLLLVHNWWPQFDVNLNHPLWSIAVEYQFYLCFPLMLAVHRRFGHWYAWVLMTILGYAAWHLSMWLHVADPSPYGASFYYASLFSMGIAAGQMPKQSGGPPLPGRAEAMAVALLVATMLVWAALDEWRYGDVASQLESFFVGVATFGLLLYAPHWRLLRQRGLPRLHELLRALGERSYSLYLLHAPLLQLSWLWFVQRLHLRSAGWQAIVEMASGALLAVLVSEVFYRVVEKPTHRWSRGLGLARRPAMSPAAQSA